MTLRIQLWSYNYSPEPTGIAPVSTVWAQEMLSLGHDVTVISAHPHYPIPRWGARWLPYRELRRGVPVVRLPLSMGRASGKERVRQELSFVASEMLALPLIPSPDVVVAVSPSFPGLAPVMAHTRRHGVPWVLWLQDILPEGAETTGLIRSDSLLRAARRFELAAYRSAERVAVISDTFFANLRRKGVPGDSLARVYNPATLPFRDRPRDHQPGPPVVVSMGNIGHSQGLDAVVRSFEAAAVAGEHDARLIILGDGVAASSVRAAITTDRVTMPGLVDDAHLMQALESATVGLVSQRSDIDEFNLPSKLMNFMARALPVVAIVRPDSEVARIVERSGAGWVVPSDQPDRLSTALRAASDEAEVADKSAAALTYATENFSPAALGQTFDQILRAVARPRTLA